MQGFTAQHRFAQRLCLGHDVNAELGADAFDEVIERPQSAGAIAGLVVRGCKFPSDVLAERIRSEQSSREADRLTVGAFAAISIDEHL